jgi:hypothetical protein
MDRTSSTLTQKTGSRDTMGGAAPKDLRPVMANEMAAERQGEGPAASQSSRTKRTDGSATSHTCLPGSPGGSGSQK